MSEVRTFARDLSTAPRLAITLNDFETTHKKSSVVSRGRRRLLVLS